jgi:hypothetical protein
MKIILIFGGILFLALPINSQTSKMLAKNQIKDGKIVYSESYKDTTDINKRFKYLTGMKIVLKDITTNSIVNIKDTLIADKDAKIIFLIFQDDKLKDMAEDDFSLFINDSLIASTASPSKDSTSSDSSASPFKIDIKPSLDLSQAQELDLSWNREITLASSSTSENKAKITAKGFFSTHPDSTALNSIQLNLQYTFLSGNVGLFKYTGLSAQFGSEHPQNFSQTNLVGSIVLSTILPWTDRLTRFITNNKNDAIIGLIFQPAIDIVRKTSVQDSNYVRGAIHGNWIIPLTKDENIVFYGVAYFQNGFHPRSYTELTIEHNILSSIAIIAKWVNGELPPLFQRESELRIGVRFQ